MRDPTVALGPGQTAVVGYGLLLYSPFLEQTIGGALATMPIPCRLSGWRRSWDVAAPNGRFWYRDGSEKVYPEYILYLNLHRRAGSTVNGSLFVVNDAQLAAIDRREAAYDRVTVTSDVRGVQMTGGEAVAYVGKPRHIRHPPKSPRVAAVRRSYLASLDEVVEALSPAQRREYEENTDPVPRHLLIHDQTDD